LSDLNLIDVAPELPRFAREQADEVLADRRPSMGEGMGASVREGWWNTTPATALARRDATRAGEADPAPLARHEWEASQWWRPGVTWDERMTVGRARAIATGHDENAYRRQVMSARDAGFLESVAMIGASIVGSIPDPVNFLPIAGPAARALRVVQGGRTAGVVGTVAGRAAATLERSGVAGGVARGATEGVVGNALAMPFVYSVHQEFGDDVTFSRAVMDLAAGAVVGAGFGALGAVISRSGAMPEPRVSARALDLAARDVAAGRQIEVPRGLVVREIEDTLFRAAPESAAPMIRETMEGGEVRRALDIPSRPDGTALTREEFEAEFARRQGTTIEAQQAAIDAAGAEARADSKRQSLIGWIVQNGGLRDDTGDLAAVVGDNRARPGLIRRDGMAPDIAAVRARDEGFFGDRVGPVNERGEGLAPDSLTKQDLIDAVEAEMRGTGARFRGGFGVERGADLSATDRMRADWDRSVDEAYDWYLAAHHAQRQIARLSEPARADVMERAAIMEADGGLRRDEAVLRAAQASDDPETQRIMAAIESLRAEGRLLDADDAMIRAAAEQADEMDAIANGIEEAGACLLRRLA
jgi:hypothetical protein